MPATDKLTDPAIRNAKPEAKPYKLGDGGGLFLLVQPNGAKWWRLKYRFSGKEKLLSVGVYPDTGLKLARKKRDEARAALAAGTDPGSERKAEKEARNASLHAQQLMARGLALPGSFEAVAREWWAGVHSAKVSQGHAARTLIRLEQDAFPWIGATPIADLKAADVLKCAQRVVERGAIETAHRLKDACGQVFRYGVAKSLCERNPVPDLKDALPPVITQHLAAVTDPAKAAHLLRAMDGYQGHPVTRAALLLSPLVFLRPGGSNGPGSTGMTPASACPAA